MSVQERLNTIAALGADRKNLPALASHLKDPDPQVRLAVVEALVGMGDPSAHPLLVRALFDQDKKIKRRCGEVLAGLGKSGIVTLFERMLRSDKPWMREGAAMGMGQFSSSSLVPLLEQVARSSDPSLAKHALASLDRQAQKGNADAATCLARVRPGGGSAVRVPALPRAGAGRGVRDNSFGSPAAGDLGVEAGLRPAPTLAPLAPARPPASESPGVPAPPAPAPVAAAPRRAPIPADEERKFDLDAGVAVVEEAQAPPPPAKPAPPRRTRQSPVRLDKNFDDMPPLAGPGIGGGAKPALKECPVCGDPTPINAFRCPNCKEQLRADAPEIHRPAAARSTGDLELADWNNRGCAYIIDCIYAFLFQILGGLLFGVVFRAAWLAASGGLIYWLFKDGLGGGQSFGKWRYNMRVVSAETGAPCTLWQSFCRNLVMFLPAVPFIELVLVCATGIRLGDRIVNTRVVGGKPDASVVILVGKLCLLVMLAVFGCAMLFSR